MPENLLTPEEVAEALGVRPKTVREWLRTGKIKGTKVGRLWRIAEDDLKAFTNQLDEEIEAKGSEANNLTVAIERYYQGMAERLERLNEREDLAMDPIVQLLTSPDWAERRMRKSEAISYAVLAAEKLGWDEVAIRSLAGEMLNLIATYKGEKASEMAKEKGLY